MGRLATVTSTSLLVAGMLLGPVASTTAAFGFGGTTYSASHFPCGPHGTVPGEEPQTLFSSVWVNSSVPSLSTLSCSFFGGPPLASSLGGSCRYETRDLRVDFRKRLLIGWSVGGGLLSCSDGVVHAKTDLGITKTDNATTVAPGQSITYTIRVVNNGPSAVVGTTVTDILPSQIVGASWTSSAAGGASGNTASGSGNINESLNLPVGAVVTYTLTGTIGASETATLSNTATVTTPAGVLDTDPANNSATDTDSFMRSISTVVSNFNGRDTRTFDLISYGTTQCAAQLEDGVTACTATAPDNSVVVANLQDETPFQFTCPGGSPQVSSGTGPFVGQCTVTMDANKTLAVLADVAT